jgi:hypothetical protein
MVRSDPLNPFAWNPHPGQQQILREARRFNVANMGRRFGKSEMAARLTEKAYVDGLPVAYCAPTHKMLAEVWRLVKYLVADITEHRSEQQHRLVLNGGGVIEMWSLEHFDTIRGRKYARLILDEAAMVRKFEEAWTSVLRPTLADFEGDAWIFSTPKGFNYFRHLWEYGQDERRTEWMSWQMPTSANPYIKEEEIEAMRSELPSTVAAQEIDAQFITDGTVFRRVIENATAEELHEGVRGGTYVMGIDWARKNDYTVFVVLDARTRTMVAMDRFSDISFTLQMRRFRVLYERFRPYDVVAEENNIGLPLVEELQLRGYPVSAFTMTQQSKNDLVINTSILLEQDAVTLLNNPSLIGEMLAFEGQRLPGGKMRYAAPEGGHDDQVIALMLALTACYENSSVFL